MISSTSRRNVALALLAGPLLLACEGGRFAPGDNDLRVNSRSDDGGNVPEAVCGPNSRPETGLQGQVPLEDRVAGRSAAGYWCNMELVGRYAGEGASWQMAWYDDCAYYGTADGDGQVNRGVTVVDVSDPANPRASAHLDTAAMLDPWESLKVNEQRAMLGAVAAAGGSGGPELDLYDLSGDCAQPELLASQVPAPSETLSMESSQVGHAGTFAPDGMTYYGTTVLQKFHAIDISDPTAPQLISETVTDVHDLALSEDGNRAYIAQMGIGTPRYPGLPEGTGVAAPGHNGLVVYDVSQIQQRSPAPVAVPIGAVFWEEGSTAQTTLPVKIGGKSYVIFTDELGSSGLVSLLGLGSGNAAEQACANGLPPWGMARIIDVSDEALPTVVSTLMLKVNDPANCDKTAADVKDTGIFGYDTHYCNVDDPQDATILVCPQFQSGVRVYDIRDPAQPREIAYYNPPAQVGRADQLPGSDHDGLKTADWCSSTPRIVKERGEIWLTCQDSGFLVLRLTNDVWPFAD